MHHLDPFFHNGLLVQCDKNTSPVLGNKGLLFHKSHRSQSSVVHQSSSVIIGQPMMTDDLDNDVSMTCHQLLMNQPGIAITNH